MVAVHSSAICGPLPPPKMREAACTALRWPLSTIGHEDAGDGQGDDEHQQADPDAGELAQQAETRPL